MSALPGWWRWMAGMRVIDDCGASYRVTIAGDAYEDSEGTAIWINVTDGGDYEPDPTDPATIGCLTARVREMWGDDAHVGVNHRDPSEWIVWARLGAAGWWSVVARGPTEWAALMASGDAAWARRGGGA